MNRQQNFGGPTYVIDGHQGAVRPADWTAGILEALKGLRRSHLVHQMSVYSTISGGKLKSQPHGVLGIPMYSKQVPSSCSLTTWWSKTLS